MDIEPLDQFIVATSGGWNAERAALIWLEAAVLVAQLSVIALFLTAYPLWRMLPRVGFSKWWALLAAFPPAAITLIWVVGLRPWDRKE